MIQLTEEQTQARDSIVQFLLDSDQNNNRIVLQGLAGSGKSTIINEVFNHYSSHIKVLKLIDETVEAMHWLFTATTNKAVDSLQKASGVKAKTIQSLLGLVVSYNGLQKTRKTTHHNNLIIVIDEASYIDYNLLYFIDEYLRNCKVIYLGDPTQLPPVGLNHSPVFMQGYPTVLLTKSIRQIGSPSLDAFCKKLRQYIEDDTDFPSLTLSSEIVHVNEDDFQKAIHAMNDNTSKILATKNHTVNKYNTTLFKAKKKRTHFTKGDRVVNNSYAKNIATDAVITIVAEPVRANRFGVDGYKYTVRSAKNNLHVFMPDKVSYIRKLYKKAIEERNWSTAEVIQNTWVDLRPHFACTIHKAQGSTFDEVFIDLNDFKSERDLKQLARLLYVGVSRAKFKVTLTGDIR